MGQNRLARILTSFEPQYRNPTEALALARSVVTKMEDGDIAWSTLGIALYRTGETQAAVEALQKALLLRKEMRFEQFNYVDWLYLAMAHWQLGQKDEARKWYNQAIELKLQELYNIEFYSEENRVVRAEADALLGTSAADAPDQGKKP